MVPFWATPGDTTVNKSAVIEENFIVKMVKEEELDPTVLLLMGNSKTTNNNAETIQRAVNSQESMIIVLYSRSSKIIGCQAFSDLFLFYRALLAGLGFGTILHTVTKQGCRHADNFSEMTNSTVSKCSM